QQLLLQHLLVAGVSGRRRGGLLALAAGGKQPAGGERGQRGLPHRWHPPRPARDGGLSPVTVSTGRPAHVEGIGGILMGVKPDKLAAITCPAPPSTRA